MVLPDPEGSPLPYTHEQLKKIADHLRRPIDDNIVRFVVGIARQYKQDEARPAHARRKADREQKRDVADAAKQAANLLKELNRLYRRHNGLRQTVIGLSDGGVSVFRALFRGGEIERAEQRLRDAAKNAPKGKAGNPNKEHVTVALMQLIWVWKNTRGTGRVSRTFFEDALRPLGFKAGEEALKVKIAEAKRYLRKG